VPQLIRNGSLSWYQQQQQQPQQQQAPFAGFDTLRRSSSRI
jgi:hypothetical protein